MTDTTIDELLSRSPQYVREMYEALKKGNVSRMEEIYTVDLARRQLRSDRLADLEEKVAEFCGVLIARLRAAGQDHKSDHYAPVLTRLSDVVRMIRNSREGF